MIYYLALHKFFVLVGVQVSFSVFVLNRWHSLIVYCVSFATLYNSSSDSVVQNYNVFHCNTHLSYESLRFWLAGIFFSSGFIPVLLSTVFAASFAHWLRWNVEIIIQTIVYLAILIDIWTKLYLFTSHRTVYCALSWRFWTRLVVWVAHISIAAHKQVIYAAHLTNCRCQFKFIGIYLGFQRFSCDVTISQRTKMVDCYNSKWILGARNDSWLFFLKKKNQLHHMSFRNPTLPMELFERFNHYKIAFKPFFLTTVIMFLLWRIRTLPSSWGRQTFFSL